MEKQQIKTIKKQYKNMIKQLIKDLNTQTDSKLSSQILAKIRQVDQNFFGKLNIKIIGHIMLTRHGRCSNWSQKKFGLNPNAALCQDSVQAMSNTHLLTKQFLLYSEKQMFVGVSPMVRAKQTASLILPSKQKLKIKIQPSLTQNSDKPSSSYITKVEDLQDEYNNTSFFSKPKKVILYKLSNSFYGDEEIYRKFQQKSLKSEQKLIATQQNCDQFYEKSTDINHQTKQHLYDTNLTKKDKIKNIQQLIERQLRQRCCDIWLIGHSKNLREFSTEKVGVSARFQFCETRSLYAFSKQQQIFYLSPPYYLIIDQDTGRIKANFNKDYLKYKHALNNHNFKSV